MIASSAADPKVESMSRAIFQVAISEQRCAELWDCLTEGGSATVDPVTRKLVLCPRSFLEEPADQSNGLPGNQ